MKRCATTLFGLLFIVAFSTTAVAQTDVTVRQINELHPDSLAALNAGGAALTANEVTSLTTPELNGELVRFVAVVMSDPRNSGLSTPNSGLPSRVHVFMRDTTSVSQGNDGMTIQVVDGAWQTNGTADLLVGDVVEVVGTVSPFFTTMQVSPQSITLIDSYTSLGLPATILDPVTISMSDMAMTLGAGTGQANWDNFASLRGQYVRIEGASILQRNISGSRPTWSFSDDGGLSVSEAYDTSLRFRNDRGDYDDTIFNPRTDDFVPPPPGSAINLQGYLTFGNQDNFAYGMPAGAFFKVNPMADSDLEITETTPIISNIMRSAVIPNDAFDVTANIVADPTRSITSTTLSYYSSSVSDTTDVSGTGVDGNYTFPIPAQTDGDFVTYFISATDNVGGVSTSPDQSVKFLANGITSVAHIQETADGDEGASPFAGFLAVDMDLTVTVQSSTADWDLVAAQEDAAGSPWTGIMLDSSAVAGVSVGDVLHITQADIVESGSFSDVTTLENITYTVTSSGAPFADKVLTTDVLVDPAIAEAHEGLTLRFENVIITNEDAGFGECSFSSDGTEDNEIEMDDDSHGFTSSFCADTFDNNNVVAFIRGTWWQSFGSHKLIPGTTADIGTITGIEDEELPSGFALGQNYPNPFNPSTTINFAIDQSGLVKVQVYDILGRLVSTIVETDLPAGTHSVNFNASNLSSGLYVYRLTAGDQVSSKTMMLLK